MSTFGIWLIGFVIFIAGLAYLAMRLGVAPVWIGIGVVILLGIGIFTGVSRTRTKDHSEG